MANIAQDQEDGIVIRGRIVGLKKMTITPKPHPETGELRPSFDKFLVVVEAAGQTHEVSYADLREARTAAGKRDAAGAIEVMVSSVRGGAGGRVYFNGGAGAGGEWLEFE